MHARHTTSVRPRRAHTRLAGLLTNAQSPSRFFRADTCAGTAPPAALPPAAPSAARADARSRGGRHNFLAPPAAGPGSAAPPRGAATQHRAPSLRRCRTRPVPRTRRQNGGRARGHVTPFVPFGAPPEDREPPRGAGGGERGPRESPGGGRGGGQRGSALSLPSSPPLPPPAGGESGEKMAAILCLRRGEGGGPGCGGDGGTRPGGVGGGSHVPTPLPSPCPWASAARPG